MAKLIYSTITSLDCCIEDPQEGFEWAEPDEEMFSFINEREASIGTYLFGRRMYETMVYWEQPSLAFDEHAIIRDFAELWRSQTKIVYSTSMTEVASAKTSIERSFIPDAIRDLKQSSALDLAVGGANLAGQALNAGLVDEIHLYLSPIVVGAGRRAFPDDARQSLRLMEEKRFQNGVVFLCFATER